MTDYSEVLITNYADQEWSIRGDDYDSIEWISDTPKPTQAELDAAWPAVQYAQAYAAVERARRLAYTIESDPLFFEWQRGDGTEQAWLDAIAAVKAAHPYPPAP